MPYIFCESCGAGSYSNVISCPRCGQVARIARQRRLLAHASSVDRSSHAAEEVEVEVRETLYGWRSQAVRLRPGGARLGPEPLAG